MMKTEAPQRCMPRTSQPAKTSFVMCWIDAYARVRVRLVVHREDHAGQRLDDERGQRRRAERLEPVDVARDLAEEEVLDAADEARALLEPVERVQDRLLDVRLWSRRASPSVGRLDRVEPGLEAVDVLAGERERRACGSSRSRRCRRPSRPRTACRGRGGRCGSRTSSGRARAPAGRRCGCPRCRTGRRGTGSRSRRRDRSGSASRRLYVRSSPCVERAVRLHRAAEVRAVVRDDREARLAARAEPL